ncbi:hypothetical protein TNCV_4490961 [Trichonephila clavipes]|nr:hypothetical protein TNCV_4490961 [Trichonephila clavipes]
MLTAVPLGLGSSPGEDIDIYECIVPSRHGGTLNSPRAASPLVRLVEGEESYTRAFGDGPRNFEPWSNDEDDTCAGAPRLLITTPTG